QLHLPYRRVSLPVIALSALRETSYNQGEQAGYRQSEEERSSVPPRQTSNGSLTRSGSTECRIVNHKSTFNRAIATKGFPVPCDPEEHHALRSHSGRSFRGISAGIRRDSRDSRRALTHR